MNTDKIHNIVQKNYLQLNNNNKSRNLLKKSEALNLCKIKAREEETKKRKELHTNRWRECSTSFCHTFH